MKFDALGQGSQNGEVTKKDLVFEIVSPQEIRTRLDDPKDPIHNQINTAVKSVLYGSKYASDHALVEDLSQETSLKVWKGADTFNSESKLSSWIYTIAYRAFLDYLRLSKRKGVPVTDSLDVVKDSNDDPGQASAISVLESNLSPNQEEIILSIDNKAIWDSLRTATTDEEYRLLNMKFKEGLSNKEIADIFGITLNVAKKKIYNLFEKIRQITTK
jgi:RNA polymerase sigma factor (sigma-70 family)